MYRQIPLSCYIHIPWCVKKCPYCDFNSHSLKNNTFPEKEYVSSLCNEIDYWSGIESRTINNIFIGGGTPSLFSDNSIGIILERLASKFVIANDAEITIEANPGTVERKFIAGYKNIGVNRVSLGIQSFNNAHLKLLGRIHDQNEALAAIENINKYFNNYNLDIMYGLPQQTIDNLQQDLQLATQANPTHLSFYNLTIEPNTYFEKYPPELLPCADMCYEMQDLVVSYLNNHGYARYEVSAYSKTGFQAKHNSNYWLFGDYIGIGAGAASKISNDISTDSNNGNIIRKMNIKHPESYMKSSFKHGSQILTTDIIKGESLIGEFMMNALRLTTGFDIDLFLERTGLSYHYIEQQIDKHISLGNLAKTQNKIAPTQRGLDLLNEILIDFI
jgi:putative oxygen-independent coproporphyrinogen III oxidase